MTNKKNTDENQDPTTELRLTIGQNLKKLRLSDKNHFTQQEVAQRISCSGNTISQIELGRQNITVDHLYHLCGLFGVDPNYFFMGTLPKQDFNPSKDYLYGLFSDLNFRYRFSVLSFLKFAWDQQYPDDSFEERAHQFPGWEEIYAYINHVQTDMRKKGMNPTDNDQFYEPYLNLEIDEKDEE